MKKFKASTFVIFFIFFMLAGSTLFAADKVNIKDVEYLKGTDFVQLRFVTDKIISIPDVFYPEEDDPKRLIMRIGDVEFNIGKENFHFDSRIIDSVEFHKENNYTDVEIKLKARVNYRVFTNRNGLYIEFPNVKRIQAEPQPLPAQPKITPGIKDINKGGRNTIKSIRVIEKNAEKIRVELVMSNEVEYNVIPIQDAPVRLAIDLQNTYSRKIKRMINHLNVKSLRGEHNSPSVFRLVFDLHYLKSYSVSLKKNILEVEFFNVKATAQKSKKVLTNADIESEKLLTQNINPPQIKDEQEQGIKVNPLEEVTPKTVLTDNTKAKKNEFFSEEKSAVAEGNAQNAEEEKLQDLEGTSRLFHSKSINEGKRKWVGELRSYHLKDQDLVNLLIHFARDTGISMVYDPSISGTVTAELNDVPWDQALDIFLRQNELGMIKEGNIIRIAPIDKLAKEATQRRALQESMQSEAKLVTRTRVLNYAKASDVKTILDKSLSSRGTIVIDSRSNTLIITDILENFNTIDGLISAIDTANPQVSIEARIIETNSNYSKNLGIQWGYNFMADSAYGNQTSMKFPNSIGVNGSQLDSQTLPATGPLGGYAVNLPAPGATSATSFSLGNVANTFRLDMAISAMQRKGKGKIIQAPRFVTQNNVQASIAQGYKIPVQTLSNNTIQVQYKDATLRLTVTPTITADDSITMQINIVNDNVDWGNFVDKFPALLTQSAETTVKAKNGETIVIGGMYKVETGSTKNAVPLLHKLPIFGNLFKSTVKSTQTRETLIFITPRIVR
jgi:type IV pilus assembly protein PilQ